MKAFFDIPSGEFKHDGGGLNSDHVPAEIRAKLSSGFLNRLLQMQRNGLITPEQMRQQLEDMPHSDAEAEVSQEIIDKVLGHLSAEPVEFDAGKILEAMRANPDKVITIDSYSDLGDKCPKK